MYGGRGNREGIEAVKRERGEGGKVVMWLLIMRIEAEEREREDQ